MGKTSGQLASRTENVGRSREAEKAVTYMHL